SLAWLRSRPVPVISIIGARKISQLEDNIGSLDVTLSAEHLKRLDEVSSIRLGFPHDMISSDLMKAFRSGGLGDRIRA
ncbi:MAG: aldo/keto reductase, partial [Akkermansiaceae bacterium]|nr:aldo/keto reductase [Akkermansiaceae bacterium]